MKLSIIIVNYNVKYYLEQCLVSVFRAIEGLEAEVYVVDNHSKDGSVDYLRARFPQVVLIDSDHNLGFARGNNIAIRQSQGEYVLLLNPDTFVGEDTLREAVRFMDEHPQAGGAGAMMFNNDGSLAPESRRGLPTPLVSFKKMLGLSKHYYMSYLPWDSPCQIEVISGAFCLLRREALDKVGLLDETFFMYGEDIDLSYRLLQGGYENWYLPLPMLHYKGESSHKTSFRYVHVFYQAMLIFFRKHYGHLSLLITLPIKAAIYLRAFVALIQMLYQRMRHSLGFVDKAGRVPVYAFVGSKEMQEECRQIVKRKGMTADYYGPETEPKSLRVAANGILCAVYDTDVFPFKDILRMFAEVHRNNVKIGTYSCKTKVIITPYDTIR